VPAFTLSSIPIPSHPIPSRLSPVPVVPNCFHSLYFVRPSGFSLLLPLRRSYQSYAEEAEIKPSLIHSVGAHAGESVANIYRLAKPINSKQSKQVYKTVNMSLIKRSHN
jgi:hypothetical protein